jgi:aminodeoxyfutalosine synthase
MIKQVKTEDIFSGIAMKVGRGERLGLEDGLALYETDDLLELGQLAEEVTLERLGRNVYFSINRHINYTNICQMRCSFCGFSRSAGQVDSYIMSEGEVVAQAQAAYKEGATEVHIVGGVHPELEIEYYLKMIEGIREACPELHIKAFTAVEIVDIAEKAGKSIEETLSMLRKKGLGSLPGGGAEILCKKYFARFCPDKPGPAKWLEVHAAAHRLGLPTNATMLYGFKESKAQRIEHLLKLRELQDESHARGKGHFQCFVPLPYINPKSEIIKPKQIQKVTRGVKPHPTAKQIQMTEIQNSKHAYAAQKHATQRAGETPAVPTLPGQPGYSCGTEIDVVDDLKTVAISRLMLDNIEHIKAFWPMLGVNLAQIALSYGADDLDGTVQQYQIVEQGKDNAADKLSVEKIKALVAETGRIPVQRDAYYSKIIDSRLRGNDNQF